MLPFVRLYLPCGSEGMTATVLWPRLERMIKENAWMSSLDAAEKFNSARASEYQAQSRIALAGYDACHELAACVLAAVVGSGTEAKRHILHAIAARLLPGAPLILAGNRYAYADHPTLLAAWGERWRMQGSTPEEVKAKLGKILQGADPPASEEALAVLLSEAGFGRPTWFFSSLFWGACIARLEA